jgi:hypothetical protein
MWQKPTQGKQHIKMVCVKDKDEKLTSGHWCITRVSRKTILDEISENINISEKKVDDMSLETAQITKHKK